MDKGYIGHKIHNIESCTVKKSKEVIEKVNITGIMTVNIDMINVSIFKNIKILILAIIVI